MHPGQRLQRELVRKIGDVIAGSPPQPPVENGEYFFDLG